MLRGWIAILYSLIFCYTAGANLWTGPSNVSGNAGDTIVCKAAQIVMLPLYKPTALSMWSAFMPLVQLAYWAYVRTKIKKKEEEWGEGKPWDAVRGIVRPGDQVRLQCADAGPLVARRRPLTLYMLVN